MGKLRVMLIDDEPFILRGMQLLIDWKRESCEIAKTASNGREALEFLKQNQVDLILADIRMPEMDGLELLQIIREEGISDADYVIVSGYNDFEYARRAIRYTCLDYLLKPVQKEALLQLVHKSQERKKITARQKEDDEQLRRARLLQNVAAVLRGRYSAENLEYLSDRLLLSGDVRFIHVCLSDIAALEEMSDEEIRGLKEALGTKCREFLQKDRSLYLGEIPDYEEDYESGFVFCDRLAKENRYSSEEEYLEAMYRYAASGLNMRIVFLVGKRVEEISRLSHSYSSACMLRSFKGFRAPQDIYYYEKEMQYNHGRVLLCKQQLDRLVQAVEQNNRQEIGLRIDELYAEMETLELSRELVAMNTNYLVFQLIHLAVEQDEQVNQEEVMHYISDHVSESGMKRDSRGYMRRFAAEYADYLIQLRKNVSRGALQDIEKEIREHYAENLTLRGLGQKYFINSAYLGQIFRKKYGQSFKDYLANFRVNEAAAMLLKTDMKISEIAEAVGYRDIDYFISRFIAQKGCTPSRYRKMNEL